jgi:hypothetical protein
MRKTTQGSRIQKGAHSLKQTANYTKTSAPNLGRSKSKEFKAMDTLREGLSNYTNQETSMESPRKSVRTTKDQTVTGDRTTEETDCQQTLVQVLREAQEQLEANQGGNDILVHGPSHQGPRVELIIHSEITEPG